MDRLQCSILLWLGHNQEGARQEGKLLKLCFQKHEWAASARQNDGWENQGARPPTYAWFSTESRESRAWRLRRVRGLCWRRIPNASLELYDGIYHWDTKTYPHISTSAIFRWSVGHCTPPLPFWVAVKVMLKLGRENGYHASIWYYTVPCLSQTAVRPRLVETEATG